MGEHGTWWSFVPGLGSLEDQLSAWWSQTSFDHSLRGLGFSDGRVDLAHVMTSLLVAALIVAFAVILRSKTKHMAAAIVPEPSISIRNFL